MSFLQVTPMQIVFDDDDAYIEDLSISINTLRKQLEGLEQKYLKTDDLRLICLHNFIRLQLSDKLREFGTLVCT